MSLSEKSMMTYIKATLSRELKTVDSHHNDEIVYAQAIVNMEVRVQSEILWL